MNEQQRISKNLTAALKTANLSKRWAARKLGISDVHLSNVLKGKSNASEDLLKELSTLSTDLRTSKLFASAV